MLVTILYLLEMDGPTCWLICAHWLFVLCLTSGPMPICFLKFFLLYDFGYRRSKRIVLLLITCIIVWSNPRRLFSFCVSGNTSHCQSTMTSHIHNDPRTWCHERKVRFLLKRQTSERTTPRTRAFISLRDDHHVWTDRKFSHRDL